MNNETDEQENFTELILNSFSEEENKNVIYYQRDNGKTEIFTGKDLLKCVDEAAILLQSMDIKCGERIAISAPSSPYYCILLFAAVKIGIVPMLIDFTISESEYEDLLKLGDVRAIATTADLMKKIPKEFTDKVPIINITNSVELAENSIEKPMYNEECELCEKDVAFILFSSGTTSRMKGIELTHKSQIIVLKETSVNVGVHEGKYNVLHVLPLSHVAGLACMTVYLYKKSEVYMAENPNSIKLVSMLQEFKPSSIVLIPKIYETFMSKIQQQINSKGKLVSGLVNNMLKFSIYMRSKYNLNIGRILFSSIRKKAMGPNMTHLLSGGTMLNKQTLDFFSGLGFLMINVYALTETNVNLISTDFKKYNSNCTGKPTNNGVEIKLINPDSTGKGEIAVKSEGLMKRYFKDPQATKEAFTEDGYFKTGDLAFIDEEGNITVTGRRKEAILLKNGEKASPEAIEAAYIPVMKDLNYAVCGIECDNGQYDSIYMFIEGNFTASQQLRIKEKISLYVGSVHVNYRVSEILFVDEIPRTGAGKYKRSKLKELVVNGVLSTNKIEKSKAEKVYEPEDGTIETSINNCIRKCANADLNAIKIKAEMGLYNDLGYDSLQMFELCVKLEEKFDKDCSAYLNADTTVQDIYSVINGNEEEALSAKTEFACNVKKYPLPRNNFDKRVSRFVQKIFGKVYDVEAYGVENIPKDKPVIYCPNHISLVDMIYILAVLDKDLEENTCTICWDKYTANKRQEKIMEIFNCVPIDRRTIGNSSSSLHEVSGLLREGKSIILFPEGTRTYDGTMGEFRLGAGELAKINNVPIIPVTLNGVFDAYAKIRKMPRCFKNGKRIRVNVTFGEPVYCDGRDVEILMDEVKSDIQERLVFE